MKGEWSWSEMLELLRLKTERQRKATHFRTQRPEEQPVVNQHTLPPPNSLPHYVLRDGNIVKT